MLVVKFPPDSSALQDLRDIHQFCFLHTNLETQTTRELEPGEVEFVSLAAILASVLHRLIRSDRGPEFA